MPTDTGVDGPNGRVSLDSKVMEEFFADPSTPTPQPSASAPQPTPEPAVAQPPAPEAPFLQAGDSVYKTREAAEEGTRQKDALIAQLRQQYALTTGIDPISKQ